MPRRKPAPPNGFSTGFFTNLGAIPILTATITVAGWYYVTSYRLNQYADDIAKVNKVVVEKTDADTVARAKIRDDFLQSQLKTNEGIAKLDTRLAVAETNQKTANETLNKIADTLQRISSTPSR